MISYAANILPTAAGDYILENASISNGQLVMQPNGRAVVNLTTANVPALTEHFCVNAMASTMSSPVQARIVCAISAITYSGQYFHYFCNLAPDSNGLYSAELEMKAEEYVSLQVEFQSMDACVMSLWELCPQTSGDIDTIIDGVKQSLPRLLFDYNTWPLTFQQRETTIALITCNLLQNTDIQGHFALTYTASTATTITLRFKDNEATELFAPVLYDVHAGRGTLGVPHAYIDRLAGMHNFIVTAQASLGTITIGTRGVLFTIDGGYLAERTIDIGTDACDIAIEQLATDSAPSYIWVIGVEAGELLVRRRAYSVQTSGVSFEPMFTLGPAKDGAIEFDGEWQLLPDDLYALYRLTTFENPYCFIIDNEDNLYVQRGDSAETKTLLDTNVSKVSVCRGFKSMYFPAQDQGLIALYIKNGQAWYRQYAYDEYTSTYSWLAAVQITTIAGTILDASVHRLNDYRVGFVLTTSTKNYWLISSRTYVGQSYKPEIIDMTPATFPTIAMLTSIPSAVSYTSLLSADRKTITFTFNYPIRFMGTDMLRYFTFPAALQEIVQNISIVNGILIITTSEALYTAYNITFTPLSTWQYHCQNQWLGLTDTFTLTYDPYGHITTEQAESPALFDLTSCTVDITQRGIIDIANNYNDTVPFVTTVTPVVTQQAITEQLNSGEDTTTFTVSTFTRNVQQILTGEEPI